MPDDGWLFAGSALMLEPATAYELKLTVVDSNGRKPRDGKAAEMSRVVRAQTRAEPKVPSGAKRKHVVPGDGGGVGTSSNPYRGLAAAQSASEPGDVFLLHAGIYSGPWVIRHSGTLEKPIVWSSAGDGPAVIDGGGDSAKHRPTRSRPPGRTTSGSKGSRSAMPFTASLSTTRAGSSSGTAISRKLNTG